MNKKKKALLLASIASLNILCRCTTVPKSIETEDGTYVESNGEYVRLNLEPAIFEPGTHIVQYNVYIGNMDVYSKEDGWGKSRVEFPEVPEGYKYVETISIDQAGYGHLNAFVHVFVNEKRVEVTPVYNTSTGKVEYLEPGRVIEEKTLELGD